jgi:hypothetical protein
MVLKTVLHYGDATMLIVKETIPAAGSVWIDGTGLYEGDAPHAAVSAAELVMGVDRPGGVFFDKESAFIHIATANAPAGATIRASCLDIYGRRVTLPTVPATASTLRVPSDPIHPRGVFKVTAVLYSADGKPLTPPIQQVFARLPRPRDIAPELSYFGVHIALNPEYCATGQRWCRIHDASQVTKWPIVEPSPGQFVFSDEGPECARKAGLAILGSLDSCPAWASINPKAPHGYPWNYNVADAPIAEPEWKAYVDKVVTHYKGTIDAWEVWNEPWGDSLGRRPCMEGSLRMPIPS